MATLNGMGGWDLSDDDIKEMQDLGMVAKDEPNATRVPDDYPEHIKLSSIHEESQKLGEFIEWLSSRKRP